MVRWVVAALLSVSLVACQGEQGPPGAPGPTGPTGPSGTVEGAVSNRYCSKLLNGYYTFQYQVIRFASGDVEAVCSIDTAADQRSGTVYYRSGDTGTVTGACWVFYDLDTASGGFWRFEANAPGERATYQDGTSEWNNWVLSYAAGDCSG